MFKNYEKKTWIKVIPIKLILELFTFSAFLLKYPQKSLAVLKALFWIQFHIKLLVSKNNEINKIRKISDDKLINKLINTSVALKHFISGKNKFSDFEKYISYEKYKEDKI